MLNQGLAVSNHHMFRATSWYDSMQQGITLTWSAHQSLATYSHLLWYYTIGASYIYALCFDICTVFTQCHALDLCSYASCRHGLLDSRLCVSSIYAILHLWVTDTLHVRTQLPLCACSVIAMTYCSRASMNKQPRPAGCSFCWWMELSVH